MNQEWSVKYYFTSSGKRPFKEWRDRLDPSLQDKIDAYITRVRAGHFKNCKPLKGIPDIYELVIDFGPGYRVYYTRAGKVILLLLSGGIKKTQKSDIETGVEYLEDFKRRRAAGTYDDPEITGETK